MKKRVLACLTALVLALGCFPATAFANKPESGIGSSSVTEQNSKYDTEVKFDHKTYSITAPHNIETVTYNLTASLAASPANLSLKNGESGDVAFAPSLENTVAKTVSDKGFQLGFKLVRGSYTDTYYDIQRIEYTFTPKGQGETVHTTIHYPLDGNHKLEGVGNGYWVEQQFILGAGGGNRVDLKPGTSYKVSVKVYTRDRNNIEHTLIACPEVDNFGSVTIPEAYTAEIGKTDLSGSYLTFAGNENFGVSPKGSENTYTVTKLQNNNASAVLTAQLHLKDGTAVASADVAVGGPRLNTVTFQVNESAGSISGGKPVQSVYGNASVKVPTVNARSGYVFIGWAAEGSDKIAIGPNQKNVKAPLAGDITYVAQFSQQTNVVTIFYENSATGAPLGQVSELVGDSEQPLTLIDEQHDKIPVGSEYTLPAAKTLVGYTFEGIYDNYGNKVTTDAVEVKGMAHDNAYFVRYTPVNYTVTLHFDSAAGSVESESISVPLYAKLDAPAFNANDGYLFHGWKLPDGSAYDPSVRITSDLELTADITHLSYTVTFLPGEHGSLDGETTQQVYHGEAAVAPTPVPNEGWAFAGWSADFSKITGELTVTALWEEKTFTITSQFRDTDGNPLENVSALQGDEETPVTLEDSSLPVQEGTVLHGMTDRQLFPTLIGYEAVGVYDKDGNLLTTDPKVTGDNTYTLVYQAKENTVTFALPAAAGSLESSTASVPNYGKLADLPTPAMNDGYTFQGWADKDGNLYDINTRLTSDIELTALYNRASYTVTFLPGEHGTVSGDAQQTIWHGEAAVAPQATPDEGWAFAGWDADFSKVTGELTVTALWREVEPEGPVNPTPPDEEEPPVGPVDPIIPTDPAIPTDPTAPVNPINPVTPAVTPGGNPPADNTPANNTPADQVTIPDNETPEAQTPVDGPTEEILDNETPQAQAPGADRMTLLDLIGAAVALIFAIAGALSKKRTLGKKGILAGIATLLVVLFFVTQPMVWRFRIADIWTIFFAVGIAAQAFTLLFKKDEEEEEAQENR